MTSIQRSSGDDDSLATRPASLRATVSRRAGGVPAMAPEDPNEVTRLPFGEDSVVKAAVQRVRGYRCYPGDTEGKRHKDQGHQPAQVDVHPEAAQKDKSLPVRRAGKLGARQGHGTCRCSRLSSRQACLSVGQARRASLRQCGCSEASLYTRRQRWPTQQGGRAFGARPPLAYPGSRSLKQEPAEGRS